MCTRENIFSIIEEERDRQVEKGYDAYNDDGHTPDTWEMLILNYTIKYRQSTSRAERIDNLYKVAALAVASIEKEYRNEDE